MKTLPAANFLDKKTLANFIKCGINVHDAIKFTVNFLDQFVIAESHKLLPSESVSCSHNL